MRLVPAAVALLLWLSTPGVSLASEGEHRFTAAGAGEAIATIVATCACDWSQAGREAVTLEILLDGSYSQHLTLTRGGEAEYRIFLGPVPAGSHALTTRRDPRLSAPGSRFELRSVRVEVIPETSSKYLAVAYAPVLHARPDTIGRFSDVPLLMWVETEEASGRRRFRYSVIFSHEDGGTPTDRLMATWGRATDIEYIYGVELDASGRITNEEYQGPKHEILPFKGPKLGRHPLLWVVTHNNMVSDRGEGTVRHAPAPLAFFLSPAVSREVVMDANPWTYDVMARELTREGRIQPGAPGGKGLVPDPRWFAYLEACGQLTDAAVAFDVGIRGNGDVQWHGTDRGVSDFRIVRSGCFRAAAPLPEGTRSDQVARVRVRAYVRPTREEEPPVRPDAALVRLERLNLVFMLDDEYRPGPSVLPPWRGALEVRAGEAAEVPH